MAEIVIRGFRFHNQTQLALYKKEQKEVGMFEFPKPLLKGTVETKCVLPILEALAEGELKGTILKVWVKNDDGCWDFGGSVEGVAKGDWGASQTAEAKAAEAQKGEPVGGGAGGSES